MTRPDFGKAKPVQSIGTDGQPTVYSYPGKALIGWEFCIFLFELVHKIAMELCESEGFSERDLDLSWRPQCTTRVKSKPGAGEPGERDELTPSNGQHAVVF